MSDLHSDLRIIALGLAVIAGLAVQARSAAAETAVLAGGCFWCVEADFEKVRGVTDVVSGFAGGALENPSYADVTAGGTGHYEVVEITYDASVVSYDQLLWLFLRSIDPLDGGGQFCDRGPSYRPAIFVATEAEAAAARAALGQAERELGRPLAVAVEPAATFWPAEAYHQDYARGRDIVLTRRGPKRQSEAYDFYREACGRDARVTEIWGEDAPFVTGE